MANAICTSFKQELLVGAHDFTTTTGDAFHWPLYTVLAPLGAGTTAYTATNEVAAGNGYTTRGVTVANVTPTTDGTSGITDFSADPTYSSATFSAIATLLFNETHPSDASVAVWDFGTTQTASGGDFVLVLPTAAAGTAILELA